jgi:hypothetical protein
VTLSEAAPLAVAVPDDKTSESFCATAACASIRMENTKTDALRLRNQRFCAAIVVLGPLLYA